MQKEAKCVVCCCTDSKACKDGCSWLSVDRDKGKGVCSNCDNKAKEKIESK